jgi:hypothetical protein
LSVSIEIIGVAGAWAEAAPASKSKASGQKDRGMLFLISPLGVMTTNNHVDKGRRAEAW